MHHVSCIDIHHDDTDWVNVGLLKIQKLEYLEKGI